MLLLNVNKNFINIKIAVKFVEWFELNPNLVFENTSIKIDFKINFFAVRKEISIKRGWQLLAVSLPQKLEKIRT